MQQKEYIRIIRLITGLTAYSLGITLTVQAGIGLSPWDVFHQGLSMKSGLTFGMASIAVSAAIVAVSLFFKEHIGAGTFLNVVYIGLVIDLLMLAGIITEARNFFTGLLMMAGGLFTIALAMVLYIGAGYGAGPRDSLMVILSKRTGKSAGLCRSAVEAIALACGWLLGGHAGIGTIISVVGIGAATQIVFSALRFDVGSVRQESFHETWVRIKRRALMKRTIN